jgi:hypothetical protein
VGWIGDFIEFLRWREERKTKCSGEKQADLGERVLAEMQRLQAGHPAMLARRETHGPTQRVDQ